MNEGKAFYYFIDPVYRKLYRYTYDQENSSTKRLFEKLHPEKLISKNDESSPKIKSEILMMDFFDFEGNVWTVVMVFNGNLEVIDVYSCDLKLCPTKKMLFTQFTSIDKENSFSSGDVHTSSRFANQKDKYIWKAVRDETGRNLSLRVVYHVEEKKYHPSKNVIFKEFEMIVDGEIVDFKNLNNSK